MLVCAVGRSGGHHGGDRCGGIPLWLASFCALVFGGSACGRLVVAQVAASWGNRFGAESPIGWPPFASSLLVLGAGGQVP